MNTYIYFNYLNLLLLVELLFLRIFYFDLWFNIFGINTGRKKKLPSYLSSVEYCHFDLKNYNFLIMDFKFKFT